MANTLTVKAQAWAYKTLATKVEVVQTKAWQASHVLSGHSMKLHVQREAIKRIYIHDVVLDEPKLQTFSCQMAAISCKVGQTDVHMYMSLEPVIS